MALRVYKASVFETSPPLLGWLRARPVFDASKLPSKLSIYDYDKLACVRRNEVVAVGVGAVDAATNTVSIPTKLCHTYILRLALKFIKKVPFDTCNLSVRVMQFFLSLLL